MGWRFGQYVLRRLPRRLEALALIAVALVVTAGCHSSRQSAPSSSPSRAPSQIELPFSGLIGPKGLALDAAGNV